MKEVKICYSRVPNLGDAVNPLIVERVLGYRAVYADEWHCEISGIGSGLRRFFVKPEAVGMRYRVRRGWMNLMHSDPVILWSAGFLSTPSGTELPARRHYLAASVRGELSKAALEGIAGRKLDCGVGDAGILASRLLGERVEKKYSLGIIPHRREKDERAFSELCGSIRDTVIIDIEPEDPIEGLRRIAECETILSSSLHGLIFADSLRVPNRHVILTDKLSGDGFKFRDYYSVYGLDDEPVDLNREQAVSPELIRAGYRISDERVGELQESCIAAFNRFIR
ncbi:MAG: polysaccharide pyruvyl transferase family protein [Oscillospiraceae bacterium]|nr:polysaccharide pyruvyl transferase family protein [Oscillospiraceae bacterium]